MIETLGVRSPDGERGGRFASGPLTVAGLLLAAIAGAAEAPGAGVRQTEAARARGLPPVEARVVQGQTEGVAAAAAGQPKLKGDAEYGEQVILTRRAHWEPWSISVDAQYFYTDNVALVPEGRKGDFYLRSGALVQYTNRIGGEWFLNADVSDYFYAHDRYREFDFSMLRAEAGVLKSIPWLGNAYLSAHYVWYQISEPDFTSSAFSEHLASLGLQKIWKIARGQQVSAGVTADLSLAGEPSEPRRHEFAGFAGYKLRLTEKLSVGTGYRGAFYDYPETGRQDWSHTASLAATYDLASWARLQVAATATWSRSNQSFFDYDNLIGGAGVTLHLEF